MSVDAFARQKAGSPLPDTAAAVAEAGLGQVFRGCIVFRAPVVQPYRGGIATDIQGDLDGAGGVELFDAFLAVAIGVPGHEPHHHAVVEAILAVRATFSLIAVGLGASLVAAVDQHIVVGGRADGERRGLIGGGQPDLSGTVHFQGGGRQLGAVPVGAQNLGREVAGIGAGPGVVGHGTDQFLAIGRYAGLARQAGCGGAGGPFGQRFTVGAPWQGQFDLYVLRAVSIGDGNLIVDLVMGTYDAILRAAVQAWTVGGVPSRRAIGGERIADVRDGGMAWQ